MVKRLQILLALFFLISCKNTDSTIEQNIYIGYLRPDFSGNKNDLTHLIDRQYFSKAFWEYFFKKFPRSTATIFYSHISRPETIINLKDTNFIAETGDFGTFVNMFNNLPKTPEGNEKVNKFVPFTFFENDSSANKTKKEDKLVIPPLTDLIKKDYIRFLDLLKDKSKIPVFVFKKEVLQQIDTIYKGTTSR